MVVNPGAICRLAMAVVLVAALAACGNLQWPPSSSPQLANRPAPAQTSLPRDHGGMVIVRRGDTLYSLSLRHRVSIRALIEANGLQPPYTIRPGSRLVLPTPKEHVVRPGDTLYSISRRYGVDVSTLAKINQVLPPYRIYVGDALRLPEPVSGVQVASVSEAAPEPEIRAGALPAPSPGPESRREQEARRTPPSADTPPRISGSGFQWPLKGKLLSGFGPKSGGLHNDGINIAAARGTPVHAAENGVVAYAGNELRGFGNLLLIRHDGGWITAYAHNEELLVRRGDTVTKGQVISRVGATGNVTSPQLHFEIRKGKQAVDPLDHLGTQTAGPA